MFAGNFMITINYIFEISHKSLQRNHMIPTEDRQLMILTDYDDAVICSTSHETGHIYPSYRIVSFVVCSMI